MLKLVYFLLGSWCWFLSTPAWSQTEILVWSDEFAGSSLDTTKWKFQTGDHGWGNNEWQDYTAGDNVQVIDGVLIIRAEKTGPGQKAGDYTSTRLNSKKSFRYGRIEVRAKVPPDKGPGLWPAIWMLGENIGEVGWPLCGEIDIMEYVSFNPGIVHQTIHTDAHNHMKGSDIGTGPVALPSIEEDFHNYGVIWTTEQLVFYVDDRENSLLSVSRPADVTDKVWPFDKNFYILLNMAVGGNWGGKRGVDDNIFPAEMKVDYVRVYQFADK